MLDDSFGSYCHCVWRHWKLALLTSLVPGIGFLLIDIILGSRLIRLAIVLFVFLLFLMYAMFKAWREERRSLNVQPLKNLLMDAENISQRLDKFVEQHQSEKKNPAALYLMQDNWLTQIQGSEISGRDVRDRLRIHRERLGETGIQKSTLTNIDSLNILDIRRALTKHQDFLKDRISRLGRKTWALRSQKESTENESR